MDSTRTKDAAIGLRGSEAPFEALFDHSPTVSFVIDGAGAIHAINSHGAVELGYSKTTLVGVSILQLVHDQDKAAFGKQLETTSTNRGAVLSRDLRLLRKNASFVWVRASTRSVTVPGGEPLFLLVCKDLTEQKETEQRLVDYQTRLRALTLESRLAEEKERRRIARGLHDSVGHSLALARMKLGAYDQSHGSRRDDELGEIRELIDNAIQATRDLTFELSSPVLYELGLEAALQGIGERVVEANGIGFSLDADEQPKPLTADTSVILYRSVRELLLNVVKHADASCVRIAVNRVRDRIEIAIADDGVGMDSPDVLRTGPHGGYGLFSIEEQLRAIGGRIDIDTAPGQGTSCTLVAPLESPEG